MTSKNMVFFLILQIILKNETKFRFLLANLHNIFVFSKCYSLFYQVKMQDYFKKRPIFAQDFITISKLATCDI